LLIREFDLTLQANQFDRDRLTRALFLLSWGSCAVGYY